MAARLRTTRTQIDLSLSRLSRLFEDRIELVELASKTMTYDDIGEQLGLSKQRIAQIIAGQYQKGKVEDV